MPRQPDKPSDPAPGYYCDDHRHLVCIPYTVEALHEMAEDLDIHRCWFHGSAKWVHYDIPKRRIAEVMADPRVTVLSQVGLLRMIRDFKRRASGQG